ncbi:unnamed protein product [Caenorhabditis auriculariae]|uniref:Endoplasmic reticulum lectin 1 n=1 Tax=Caenorhabditis auriculariae TaxID=2777116 RepID=A0A8S1GMP1_9PELO|nr:unnamed protein product [Caenorhabditis auriculariae]
MTNGSFELEDDANDDYVRITTKNNERFYCKIPQFVEEDSHKIENYNGPSPQEILDPLYKRSGCSYLVDAYWNYEVCHGRYVIQYHDEKHLGSVYRTEYYLGNHQGENALEAEKKHESLRPPSKRIETEDYPYYSVSYTRGTQCDITQKPRSCDVLYICVENVMQPKILSVTEVSSCHYEIIIMSALICDHPAYRLKTSKDQEIICVNLDAENEEAAKPRSLQRLDDFHDTTFKREYSITHEDFRKDEELLEESEYENLKKYSKRSASAGKYKLAGKKRFTSKDTLANNKVVVDHTVNSIFTGFECIVGGEGWWKYEFCYGKQVIQYHQELNGHRDEIILGVFDEKMHKLWVDESPKTRGPQKVDNHVAQVSHFYSKGDLCEEAGGHRSIEVRLRCHHSEYSSLSISLALTEPKTCQYVLTIDSERFCEPLQYSDDYGLIKLKKVSPENSEDDVDEEDEESLSSL